MAILPFPSACLKRGIVYETEVRTRTADFGDGYTQNALDGLNSNTLVFTADFSAQKNVDAQSLLNDLLGSIASDAFEHTPRSHSAPLYFEVAEGGVIFRPLGPFYAEVSAKFRQVYL